MGGRFGGVCATVNDSLQLETLDQLGMCTMTTITRPDKTLERAISDYLSVSRSAHLFGALEYEKAELDAWERLVAARETTEVEHTA